MVFNVSYFPGGDDFGDPLHFFRKHVISIAVGLALAPSTSGSAPTATARWPIPCSPWR